MTISEGTQTDPGTGDSDAVNVLNNIAGLDRDPPASIVQDPDVVNGDVLYDRTFLGQDETNELPFEDSPKIVPPDVDLLVELIPESNNVQLDVEVAFVAVPQM